MGLQGEEQRGEMGENGGEWGGEWGANRQRNLPLLFLHCSPISPNFPCPPPPPPLPPFPPIFLVSHFPLGNSTGNLRGRSVVNFMGLHMLMPQHCHGPATAPQPQAQMQTWRQDREQHNPQNACSNCNTNFVKCERFWQSSECTCTWTSERQCAGTCTAR